MSGYNTKNYTEQGGDVTHIGGKLVIEKGATVEGMNENEGLVLPEASETTPGVVRAAANEPTLKTTDLAVIVSAFNSLLSKLKNAGLMVADTVPVGA